MAGKYGFYFTLDELYFVKTLVAGQANHRHAGKIEKAIAVDLYPRLHELAKFADSQEATLPRPRAKPAKR